MNQDKHHLHTRYDTQELYGAVPPDEQGEFNQLPSWMVPATIAQYEMGDLLKSLMYSWRYAGDAPAYVGEARMALSDLLTMLRLICAHTDINFWQALVDGEEKYMERMLHLNKRLGENKYENT